MRRVWGTRDNLYKPVVLNGELHCPVGLFFLGLVGGAGAAGDVRRSDGVFEGGFNWGEIAIISRWLVYGSVRETSEVLWGLDLSVDLRRGIVGAAPDCRVVIVYISSTIKKAIILYAFILYYDSPKI
jgi:hypothetical protein